MLSDPFAYLLVFSVAINLGLLGALLLTVRSRQDDRGLVGAVAGRFDAIERNYETLRRAFGDMDQGLRAALAAGARDGLAAAFDKVQQGTRAQADGLVHVQQALNQLTDTIRGGFEGFSLRLREEQEQLRGRVEMSLERIRSSNEAALEQMRVTVDASLQA